MGGFLSAVVDNPVAAGGWRRDILVTLAALLVVDVINNGVGHPGQHRKGGNFGEIATVVVTVAGRRATVMVALLHHDHPVAAVVVAAAVPAVMVVMALVMALAAAFVMAVAITVAMGKGPWEPG